MDTDSSECCRSSGDLNEQLYSFQCEVCNVKCVNKVVMPRIVYAHLLNQSPAVAVNKKLFRCVSCNEIFHPELKLKIHGKEISSDQTMQNKFYCLKCKKNFPSLKIAEEHRLIHHRPGIKKWRKTYRCDLCNHRFYLTETLNQHLTLHVVEKPFKCTNCTKAYRCRKKWKQHQKLHFQDSPFKCNACKKNFLTRRDFNRHIRGHIEGDKTCHVCRKKFSDMRSLRMHLLKHSGKTPFCCDICGETYVHQYSLAKHKKLHPECEDQFKCGICQKGFNSGTVFKQHIEQVHSADNELLTHVGGGLDHGPEGGKGAPVPTSLLFKLPASLETSCATLTALPIPCTTDIEDLPVPTPPPLKLSSSTEDSTAGSGISPVPTSLPSKPSSAPELSTSSSESLPVSTSLSSEMSTFSEINYPAMTALRALLNHCPKGSESLLVPTSLPLELPSALEHNSEGTEILPTYELHDLPSPSKLSSAIRIVPAFYD